MKQTKREKVIAVIEQLSDGQFHSGETIGDILGVSRTAVSQYIQDVQALGLDVFRVTGKGYRLQEPLQLIKYAMIKASCAAMEDSLLGDVVIERVVSSTNDTVKEQLQHGHVDNGYTVFAEAQTSGRGRRGKRWISPFGSNLYMSMYWRLEQGMTAAMGLSLALGTIVAEVITELGIPHVELKWPNDVLVDGKKIAGILVELEGQAMGVAHAIVGIGLNLAMPSALYKEIDQPWTDIRDHLGHNFDRNELAAQLLTKCRLGLAEYEQQGLRAFIERWQQFDRLRGQPVRIIMGHKEVTGIAEGIDDTGAIMVDCNGTTQRFHAGEVSLRHGT